MKCASFLLLVLLVFSSSLSAREWLPATKIYQLEARDGTWVSAVLHSSDNKCPSNRVQFKSGKWIDQNGVNHYYSLLMMAFASDIDINLHVEIEDGNCFGRIGFVRS